MASNRNVRPAREEDLERLIDLGRRSWLSAFAQTAPVELEALVRQQAEQIRQLEARLSVLETGAPPITAQAPAAPAADPARP